MPPLTATKRQSWQCPLVFVFVDKKQVASGQTGDVILVLKSDIAARSSALNSRQVHRLTASVHTLSIFVGQESEARLVLVLDGFLNALPPGNQVQVSTQAPVDYSVKARRLRVQGSPLSTLIPLHDFRFKGDHDLLEAVKRLENIGIRCHRDDKPPAPMTRPYSSQDLRTQILSPELLEELARSHTSLNPREDTVSPYIFTAQELKTGKVISPLGRNADGSPIPCALLRFPKRSKTTSTPPVPSQQEAKVPASLSLRSPMAVKSPTTVIPFPPRPSIHGQPLPSLLQHGLSMLPPKRDLTSAFKPASKRVNDKSNIQQPAPWSPYSNSSEIARQAAPDTSTLTMADGNQLPHSVDGVRGRGRDLPADPAPSSGRAAKRIKSSVLLDQLPPTKKDVSLLAPVEYTAELGTLHGVSSNEGSRPTRRPVRKITAQNDKLMNTKAASLITQPSSDQRSPTPNMPVNDTSTISGHNAGTTPRTDYKAEIEAALADKLRRCELDQLSIGQRLANTFFERLDEVVANDVAGDDDVDKLLEQVCEEYRTDLKSKLIQGSNRYLP